MILINYDRCDGCGECVKACPAKVFEFLDDTVVVANPQDCLICCNCMEVCPREAIVVEGC